jgi:hypothetical protein
MRFVRCATVGVAIAIGGTGAYAQSVISRTIDPEPVETTVVQGPNGTVITRRPVAPAVAPLAPAAPLAAEEDVRVGSATYMDETVGAAPPRRATTRTTNRVVHAVHHDTRPLARTETRTVHTVRRAAPIVLAPAERRVIYRTIVQQQVVPSAVIPVPPPGYPPYPAPATTGYAVTAPAVDYDDVYAERVRPAYPVASYTVGSVLPASIGLTPMPAAVAVPAARPYSYATIDGRVLLVDPVTYTVVADITP